MGKRILGASVFAIALSLCAVFLSTPRAIAQTYEGKKIAEVEFEGLVQSDAQAVRNVVSSKTRMLFSQDLIDKDIKALYNLDLFEDIQVDVTESGDGVKVTFLLTELPTIRKIEIRGNNKLSDRAIKDKILIKEGSVFREQGIYEDIQAVEDLYEEKGYPQTVVDYEIKESKEKDKKSGIVKNTVDLTFLVDESRKLIVESIQFSGVSEVKTDKLLNLMKTRQQGRWLSSGHLKEDQLELDKIEILKYYGKNGYIDARIVKVDKSTRRNDKKNRDEMDLVIYMEEGKQYTFGGVEITGNEIFTAGELYPLIKSKPNQVFDQEEFQKGVQAVRNLMADNGYIYYSLDLEERKDSETLSVSYKISIRENKKAHVENIFVTGNKKTKKFVIERELQIIPGEIFNSKKVQQSIEKLYNLQYFGTVNVDVKPGSELGLIDLIFDVEEQRTGLFTFGLSYSTSGYGLSLFEEVSANNFLGRGLRLYEKVEFGYTRMSLELGLDEPWLFNTPTSAGITLGFSKITYGTASGYDVYTWNDQRTAKGPTGAHGLDPPNPDLVGPDGVRIPDGVFYTYNPESQTYTADYTKAYKMTYTNRMIRTAFRLGRRFGRYYGIGSEIGFSVLENFSGDRYTPSYGSSRYGLPVEPFDQSLADQFTGGVPNWKNYISFNAYRDTRDSTLFAKRGTLLSQTFWFYGGPLGGHFDYLRSNTEFNFNVKTFWKFILSTRLNVGFIKPWLGLTPNVDESDKIRIDGMNEGRGWQRPSQQFKPIASIAGTSELNISIEHRFPISERLVWGMTFFDISGIYGGLETPRADFSVDPKNLFYSFGLGASLMVPGFPIRLYLVRRFAYDNATNSIQFANSQHFFQDWDFVFAVAGFF